MSQRQIDDMKGTALVFLAVIVCCLMVYLAIEVHKHKSAYKLPRHSIIYPTINK